MQIFMTNWDVLDKQNEILEVSGPGGPRYHYIISDLGRTFGKYGNNNLPIITRLDATPELRAHTAGRASLKALKKDGSNGASREKSGNL